MRGSFGHRNGVGRPAPQCRVQVISRTKRRAKMWKEEQLRALQKHSGRCEREQVLAGIDVEMEVEEQESVRFAPEGISSHETTTSKGK